MKAPKTRALQLNPVTTREAIAARPTAPAYNYGWSQHLARPNACWKDIETELERNWDALAGSSDDLDWDDVHDAALAGWMHVDRNGSQH